MSWQNRADLCIAQGALTNSKRPSTFINGIYPTHATHGRGAYLYADGKAYLDFYGGLGVNLFGYGNPLVAEHLMKRYMNGACLSLSSTIEVELAEKLKTIFPWTDLWKFLKTGSEACSGALRIARMLTKRDLVLSDAYHGWQDDFISMTPPALGIPKRGWMMPLDFDLIPKAAAVIIEPVMLDESKARKEWLARLRAECTKHGTVLIFDEIITGLRFPGLSVSKYYGIEPDLILLGKSLGGGLPLSAIGGKKDVMNCGEYFLSGTHFGETCSMQMALTTLDLLTRDGTRFSLKELWDAGNYFLSRFNELCPNLKIRGYPTRGVFEGDELTRALFWQEACRAGLLFGPSWFFTFPLMSEVDNAFPVMRDIFSRIALGSVKLHGEMPKKPFAQVLREAS